MKSLAVEKVTHVNQVVRDFAGANAFYQRVFGAAEYMNSYEPAEDRDASLFVIGDTCIELFSPRNGRSLLGAHLTKYGESWHSFEIKVPDLEEARAVFEAHGIRITTHWPGAFFMVHPKDAHGLLFEVCCLEMPGDPRLTAEWSSEPWRVGPLGIRRLNALTAAVRDLDATTELLSSLFGTGPLHRGARPGLARVACFWLGDTMLELAQADGEGSPVAAYVDRHGPRLRSLVFQVEDVDRARAHLSHHGVGVVRGDGDGWIAIDPRDNHGVLYQFTEDPQPGDPRPR